MRSESDTDVVCHQPGGTAGTPGRRVGRQPPRRTVIGALHRRRALRFDHVSMVFPDGTHAVRRRQPSTCEPGEFVTVVGPSGCGKSTLLRIASGLETEHRRLASPSDRKSLGYVFQDATLLPWRTVRRNVELLAELQGMDKAARRQRGPRRDRARRPEGFEDKYPKQLSGGMKMRASLARSLVLQPEVFLFDEPFGALDEITRERLNDELLRLFQLRGLRRPVHHPLDRRGGLPLDAGARDVGAARPDRRRVRRPVRLSRGPTTCATSRPSPSCAARSRTRCGERTHERLRFETGAPATAPTIVEPPTHSVRRPGADRGAPKRSRVADDHRADRRVRRVHRRLVPAVRGRSSRSRSASCCPRPTR